MDQVENAASAMAQDISSRYVTKTQLHSCLCSEMHISSLPHQIPRLIIEFYPAGQDLSGNTFWEFRDQIQRHRWRRMVKAGPLNKGRHYADVEVSPQWHQWLRHTRMEPPTITEQQHDVVRQIQLKHNAKLADERWAAKAKYIEKPKPQPRPMLSSDIRVDAGKDTIEGDDSPAAKKTSGMKDAIEDPWETAKQTSADPRAAYQPESWTPGPSKKR